MLNAITNYYPVTDRIASSGQPFPRQFVDISQAGFEVVINLSMLGSGYALVDEGVFVTALGMEYKHIPIPWLSPSLQHYFDFVKAMERFVEKKIWVHCAMNTRSSCLLYLYRHKYLGVAQKQALYPMRYIWQPEGPWRNLVEQVLTR